MRATTATTRRMRHTLAVVSVALLLFTLVANWRAVSERPVRITNWLPAPATTWLHSADDVAELKPSSTTTSTLDHARATLAEAPLAEEPSGSLSQDDPLASAAKPDLAAPGTTESDASSETESPSSTPAGAHRSSLKTNTMAHNSSAFAYPVCGVTKLKNRAAHLIQWIEYHLLAGIGHFYIVLDCSEDNFTSHSVLRHYSELGLVHYWPAPDTLVRQGLVPQVPASLDPFDNQTTPMCRNATYKPDAILFTAKLVAAAKQECEWIFVFDVDEYVTAVDASKYFGNFYAWLNSPAEPVSVAERTTLHTRQLPPAPLDTFGMAVKRLPWMIMGTEGLERHPKGRMTIETYKRGVYYMYRVKSVRCCAVHVG